MAGNHKIYYVGSAIGSVGALARTLDVSEKHLRKIADRVDKYYVTFEKEVKSKTRTLSEPFLELKILQKRILNRIFCHVRFPTYLHGGVKAATPRDFYSNASAHKSAEVVITLDIRGYFPSILPGLVEETILRLFSFPAEVASILAKLTTLNNQLPQGAPTSSCISNLVMFEKEYRVASTLEAQGLVYTRLIDDITVSSPAKLAGERVTKIIDGIAKMLSFYGFKLHPGKTQINSRSNPEHLMTVTGLWLNRGIPKLEKKRRVQISTEVINLRRKASVSGVHLESYHDEFNSVSGKVALLQRLGHSRALRLRNILNGIVPVYDASGVARISNLVRKFCKNSPDENRIGYIKKFYRLQHCVSIVKRTDVNKAAMLQQLLNKKRPTRTLSHFYD